MKKNIIFLFAVSLFFMACEPNKDIYAELDEVHEKPLSSQGVVYEITPDDYDDAKQAALSTATTAEDSLWADYISTYKSFNDKYTANQYVPAILASNFPQLKETSNIIVHYNQYIGKMYGQILDAELGNADYVAMGGTVETDLSFSETNKPSSFIPGYLLTKFPDAVENNYAKVLYNYPRAEDTDGGFYMFDGTSWSVVTGSKVLSKDDYTLMGTASGEPGQYGNFSEDALPQSYLPQFLHLEYPYAQAGETVNVVCDLYGYDTSIYTISCTFDGAKWAINFPGFASSAQFVHTEVRWIFDPTVRFTMNADDFQSIVDEELYPDTYGTGGYYYGASSYYSNFDIRLTKRRSKVPEVWTPEMTDEEGMELIWNNLREGVVIMLQKKFPEATPDVEGVEVFYYITFDTFNDDYQHIFYEMKYKCTSAGSPATFEMVTDAEVVE